jgi:hypothetical protein
MEAHVTALRQPHPAGREVHSTTGLDQLLGDLTARPAAPHDQHAAGFKCLTTTVGGCVKLIDRSGQGTSYTGGFRDVWIPVATTRLLARQVSAEVSTRHIKAAATKVRLRLEGPAATTRRRESYVDPC